MIYEPLKKEEVRSVIEGKSIAGRVPIFIHFWVHPHAFGEREQEVRSLLARYPEDVLHIPFRMPNIFEVEEPEEERGYCWIPYMDPFKGKTVPHDERIVITDWGELDEILEKFPDFNYPGLFADQYPENGRYRLGRWFFCLFERHWSLRGMTNALTDYYDHPREVHRLFQALTGFYIGAIERAREEQHADGIWTSDDLGTQTGPFFSTSIFREFFLPYYKKIFTRIRELGMHSWMHACGNVEPFIPDWLDAGLDVLHPIQKHTMSEPDIAGRFGDRLTIFSGIDVQQIIPWGTPEEVKAEVRYLIDTFWRPGEGKCMLTAGNGINQDCSLDSLEAFFEEALRYGTEITA